MCEASYNFTLSVWMSGSLSVLTYKLQVIYSKTSCFIIFATVRIKPEQHKLYNLRKLDVHTFWFNLATL